MADDPGAPVSYLVLAEGTPVVSSDRETVGTLRHVLADPDHDVFDGLVVEVDGGHRFVDASQVGALFEREVRLSVDAASVAGLPEPSENPPAVELGPDDVDGSEVAAKLRRAWDFISGRY